MEVCAGPKNGFVEKRRVCRVDDSRCRVRSSLDLLIHHMVRGGYQKWKVASPTQVWQTGGFAL